MKEPISIDIIALLEATLNHVDCRLIDHGKRVAYLVYQALQLRGGLSEQHIADICLLATIHDIGAYKTEEIDQMLLFETKDVWDHSMYGYLFVNYLSPLSYLAPVLLFHHANLVQLEHLHPSYRHLAQLIFVADRIDLLHQANIRQREALLAHISAHVGTLFDPDIVSWVFGIHVDWQAPDFGCANDAAYQAAYRRFNSMYPWNQQLSLLDMIIHAIEFRSPQTVTHTITTMQAALSLGALAGLPEEQLELLKLGSMVHDIGKVGIPSSILESPNRFSASEFQIMKQHVVLSAEILEGKLNPEIIQLATRHHERLDGSGYSEGLVGALLSREERILAVADVFSALCGMRTYKVAYPKAKVIHILEKSRDKNQLDRDIVNLCITHYDEILAAMRTTSRPLLIACEKIRGVHAYLIDTTKRISKPNSGLGLLLNQKLTAFEL